MRRLSYQIESLNDNVFIPIGDQGECGCTEISIDINPWLEDVAAGTVALLVERPDEVIYLAKFNINAGILKWLVDDIATGKCGVGHLQVQMSANGAIVKSTRCEVKINQCVQHDSQSIVTASNEWIDGLLGGVEDTAQQAREAAQQAIQAYSHVYGLHSAYDFLTGEMVIYTGEQLYGLYGSFDPATGEIILYTEPSTANP